MQAMTNPNTESEKMKSRIIIIILAMLGIYGVMSMTGCATTTSQPTVQADAAETGGSWTHQNINQQGINLGDLASVKPKAPQAGESEGKAVAMGDSDITPEQMQREAARVGASFTYVGNVTVNQSVTGGAEAKRAGTVSQSPGNGNTDQTADNETSPDVEIDAGGLIK
ncbi:MAG TPA: hypothetical protein DER01_00700 [Phycisphaerales bacterium]|nr:hypothetical protein [Phycisphaerales bacterium]|tara:strand:+ start:438 stop:941 length:504 start_codon:yes stop_codon:yes gene_type:complete